MALGWITAGASLLSSFMGANAANDAASIQAGASDRASANQLAMFQQMRGDLAPYMQQGQVGLNQLNELMKNPNMVTQLPGYQFQMQQGTDAIMNGASTSGLTGNTLKGLEQYGQGLGANYLNNYWNQMMGLAQLGQTSAAGVGSAGISTGQSIGNNIIGAGNAMAAGQVGAANAWSNGINNGLQNWLMYQSMNQNATPAWMTGG